MHVRQPHLPHAPQGLPPVDARHGQVHEDGVRPVAGGQQIQRIVAAGRLAQLKAQGFEQLHQQLAVGLFVVHDQDAAALAGIPSARALGLHSHRRRRLAQRIPMHLGQKQLDVEHRAHAWGAAHRQLAAHERGEHLGNGQAQACARRGRGVATARAAARKGLEDALDLLGCEAWSGVLHLDARHFACIAHAQRDGAVRGELDGVAQQVDEDLAQALFVGTHHFRNHAQHIKLESQALGRGLQFKQAGHLVQAIGKTHGRHVQRELAGFDARNIERALDEREQVLAPRRITCTACLRCGGTPASSPISCA